MSEDAMTLGEISRAVGRLEQEIGGVRRDIKGLEERVPTKEMIAATEKAWLTTMEAQDLRWSEKYIVLDGKIGDLENWKTWAIRIVIGAVILAVISLVIVTGHPPK